MPTSSIALRRIVALGIALTALTLLAGAGSQAVAQDVIAQASEEEAVPPRRRGVVKPDEESDTPADRSERAAASRTGFGVSRRLDPFDAANERIRSLQQMPQPASSSGAVTCEAGCDGPRGTIVYQKK
jgi:hypothetical protein